jgi:hypothetical protein
MNYKRTVLNIQKHISLYGNGKNSNKILKQITNNNSIPLYSNSPILNI